MAGSGILCCFGVISLLCGIGSVVYVRALCKQLFDEYHADFNVKLIDLQSKINEEITNRIEGDNSVDEVLDCIIEKSKKDREKLNKLIETFRAFDL